MGRLELGRTMEPASKLGLERTMELESKLGLGRMMELEHKMGLVCKLACRLVPCRLVCKLELGRRMEMGRLELEMGRQAMGKLAMGKLELVGRRVLVGRLMVDLLSGQQRQNRIRRQSSRRYVWCHRVQQGCIVPAQSNLKSLELFIRGMSNRLKEFVASTYLDVVTITVFALGFVVASVRVSYFIGEVVFGWSIRVDWFLVFGRGVGW